MLYQKYYLSIILLTAYYAIWQTNVAILQHNPQLDLNAKELKLKFITMKEIQLHKHIMQ